MKKFMLIFLLAAFTIISSCQNEDGDDSTLTGEPSVTTHAIYGATPDSAHCGGYIINEGWSVVTQCGVCWSTAPFPTATGVHSVDTVKMNNFSSVIRGLNPETTYNVRAYAKNSHGIGYGEIKSFTTPNRTP